MLERWDVIVVGARCAGTALAAKLARSGVRTLVLDADARGSDMPMSTHFVQPAGMRALERLGVAARVRALTPATTRLRVALDDAEAIATYAPENAGYCVRRSTLDPLLQDAAEASGATLRFRQRVVDLVRSEGRVAGVVVDTPRGRETLRADFVVGADGARSTVAKRVEAPEYLVEESTRGGYWSYYPSPACWTLPWDSTLEHRGSDIRYVFRSDGDLTVVIGVSSCAEAASWGRDYREKLGAFLAASPTTAPLTEGREPVGRTLGLLRTRFFYRKPIGPGYALIGDAGHYKDFVTGQGITDALLDGERLADALLCEAREAALEVFWHARDVATLALHFDAIRQGRIGYNTALTRWIMGHVGKSPELLARIQRVALREITPGELVPTARLARWMAEALLRGRLDVLRELPRFGKTIGVQKQHIARERALLEAAEARLRTSLAARESAATTATLHAPALPVA